MENKRIGQFKSYIEAPKWAGIKNFLRDLSYKNDCPLTILSDEKGFFRENVEFSFKGEMSGLEKIRNEISAALDRYQVETFVSEKYKVKSAKITEKSSFINMAFTASKWSKVKDLIQKVADELEVTAIVQESSNGLLKGKTVQMETVGTAREINKFKQMMLNHLIIEEDSKPTNSKKIKI